MGQLPGGPCGDTSVPVQMSPSPAMSVRGSCFCPVALPKAGGGSWTAGVGVGKVLWGCERDPPGSSPHPLSCRGAEQGPALPRVPVMFKDAAACFSLEERAELVGCQEELYWDVTSWWLCSLPERGFPPPTALEDPGARECGGGLLGGCCLLQQPPCRVALEDVCLLWEGSCAGNVWPKCWGSPAGWGGGGGVQQGGGCTAPCPALCTLNAWHRGSWMSPVPRGRTP